MVDSPAEKLTGAENVVWDLSIFYAGADDLRIKQDMDKIAAQVDAFAKKYRGRIAELSAADINTMLSTYEAMMDAYGRLGSYVHLLYSTDTNNAQYGALVQQYTEHSAEQQQKTLFIELEWAALDDEVAQKILADDAVGKYRHYLESERRYKPYRLSEVEEQLLVEKSVTGASAWGRLFTQISGAMRFDYDGESLTQSQVLAKIHDMDRDVRRKAAESVTATLHDKSMEMTYIFNVLAADKAQNDRRRGYPSWISARNLDNKAPDDVVAALVEAVTSRYDLVARHYTLKRTLLGYDELTDYDRYAPLPVADEKEYQWDDARSIVQSAYDAFSPQVGAVVGRFFSENWIHAALAPGKRGGAFSASTVPSAHPFVLMNYTGKASDIRTLAHELGHGVHQYLANERQGLINAGTPLTTAEMASVFGEMLVFTDLMNKETDAKTRLAMVAEKVEDTFATVYRQVAMNRFEDAMHNARRSEGELATERLSDMWLATQRAMFQGSVNLRDDYAIWWSYIPHFVQVPGYVYAYAFGELLVLALFNLYRERGADFVPQYVEVLAAGGSDYPHNILAQVGVDLRDPAFWHEGLDAIRDLVEQEEQLARQVYPEKFEN